MHYGNYFFLALLCIFQPVISERNLVDGRQYRCNPSFRSELSERRSYALEDNRKQTFCPEAILQRNNREQLPYRYRDLVDSKYREQGSNVIRQFKTNEDRNSYSRNIERRSIARFSDNFDRSREERNNVVSRMRYVDNPSERAFVANVPERRARTTFRNSERSERFLRSRSEGSMRQDEKRGLRHRDLHRERTVTRINIHDDNTDRRLSRSMSLERRENTERLPSLRSRSNNREQIHRSSDIRNTERDVRDRRSLDKRQQIINERNGSSEEIVSRLRTIGTQREIARELRILQRSGSRKEINLNTQTRELDSMRIHRISQTRRRNTARYEIRSVTRRNNIVNEPSINAQREISELRNRNLNNREQRYVTHRDIRELSGEVRLLGRDLVENREMRDNLQARDRNHIRENTNEMRNKIVTTARVSFGTENTPESNIRFFRNELTRKSLTMLPYMERTSSRLERRNVRENPERNMPYETSQLTMLLDRDRTSSRLERRNIREYSERSVRYEMSRNIIGSFKNEERYLMSKWQILIYTLQGLYFCSILIKMLNKNDTGKKQRFLGWFPVSGTMKID